MGIESAIERVQVLQGRMADLGARLREPMLGAGGGFAARLAALSQGRPEGSAASQGPVRLERARPSLGPQGRGAPAGWQASQGPAEGPPRVVPEVISGSVTTAEQTLGIARLADESARRHGLDPALMRAVMTAESGGDPEARSPVGAIGLMQLMPSTARELGVDPEDPAQNLEGGAKYLASLVSRFGLSGGVAAYNAGPGAVAQHRGKVPPYPETQAYVQRVLALHERFRAIGLGAEGTP